MHFKLIRFFHLASNFLIGLAFLCAGFFIAILAWSHTLQHITSEWITQRSGSFFLFGFICALIGIAILCYVFLSNKRRYICIQVGPRGILFDENIIRQYLDSYWKHSFPNQEIPYSITIKKNSIQIVAHLPSLPLEEQKNCLEKIEKDLSDLFQTTLGYPKSIFLAASFESPN